MFVVLPVRTTHNDVRPQISVLIATLDGGDDGDSGEWSPWPISVGGVTCGSASAVRLHRVCAAVLVTARDAAEIDNIAEVDWLWFAVVFVRWQRRWRVDEKSERAAQERIGGAPCEFFVL